MKKGVSDRMVYKNRIKWRKIQQNNKFAGVNQIARRWFMSPLTVLEWFLS